MDDPGLRGDVDPLPVSVLTVKWLRWLLFTAPARACTRLQRAQGRLPWIYLPISLGPLAGGGVVGSILGWRLGDVPRGAASGAVAGTVVPLLWWTYVGAFAAVHWSRGRSYETLAGANWGARPKRWYDS